MSMMKVFIGIMSGFYCAMHGLLLEPFTPQAWFLRMFYLKDMN